MVIDQKDHEEEPWEGDEYGDADEADAGQLALDGGDEQLPWLESDEDYEDEGVDSGRIIALAIIGLLVVGLVLTAGWWFTRDRTDPELVADGSTIEAPEGPYKTPPTDPGGRTFEGTGDASFAVAEGQSREGQIAPVQSPQPSIDVATATPNPPAAPSGVGVQVGAYSTRQGAEQGWPRLVATIPALSGHSHRVLEGQADIGTVFRLQAMAADLAAANELCRRIKAAGGNCQVKP